MGLLEDFKRSLKPSDVEETVDRYFHRPLAFLLARAALPTPISPNQITLCSMVLGVASAISLVLPFRGHMAVSGLLLLAATIFDCADGQLARMRKTASAFGRMLDAAADVTTTISIVLATSLVLYRMYSPPAWQGALVVLAGLLTVWSGSWHAAAHDHYKNVYTFMTQPVAREGEDLEGARKRWEEMKAEAGPKGPGLFARITYALYAMQLEGGAGTLRWFDPDSPTRYASLPAYDEETAAIYKKHALPPMRLLRALFGFGMIQFGFYVGNGLGRPDVMVAVRLLVWNAVFLLVYRPIQRRATRRAFAEIAELARRRNREAGLAA